MISEEVRDAWVQVKLMPLGELVMWAFFLVAVPALVAWAFVILREIDFGALAEMGL